MEIQQGHHTGLTVKSLEESLKFYKDLLKLELVYSWNPKANYIAQVTGYKNVDFHIAVLKVPGIEYYIELIEYRGAEVVEIDHRNGNPGIAHIAFKVDNLDEWFEFLNGNNIHSVSKPVIPELGPNRGGKIIYMIDPDGYRVELIQTNSNFGDFSPINKY